MSVLHHMLLSRVTNNIPNYFCLVALEDGTFTFNINENAQLTSIAYSLDGRNWTSSTTTLTTPTVSKGKSVYWKGIATKYSENSDSDTNNSYFSSTGNFYVKGDLMSLFYEDNFENQFEIPDTYAAASLFEGCTKLLYANKLILKATTLKTGCYGRMFYNCTNLLAYPKLPATSLAQMCYAYMFGYCRSMITAPELPATDLAYYCYLAMFYYCTNLINPPELPATTLIAYCYMRMFERCSNLEVAPDLLASNLERYCYYYMFRYCTKLRFINAQFEDTTIPSGALSNWVGGVASEGIFLKNPISEFSTVGNSGIPTGWTVWTEVPDWLCFTALESGTFTLTVPATVTSNYLSYVEYSLDGRTWVKTEIDSTDQTIVTPTILAGGKVYWRGNGVSTTIMSNNENSSSKFSSTCKFNISGHIISILKENNLIELLTDLNTDRVGNVTFAYLFKDTKVVDASNLILPSFSSFYSYIFIGLFFGCPYLEETPALPSTTLASHCYNSMFRECNSLTKTPILPATILAASCYRYMFYDSLNVKTVQPILATTALGTDCMNLMFRRTNITSIELNLTGALTQSCLYLTFVGCSELKYVKCLVTDISETTCTYNWLGNVSDVGTFVQDPNITWPTGTSGIPTGWLIYDNGKDIPKGYTACDYIHVNKGSALFTGIYADLSTYGCELEYNYTQDEIDYAVDGNHLWLIFYYYLRNELNPDFPKQTYGTLYLRNLTGNIAWLINAGIYTNPTTGVKSTNSSLTIIAKCTVGWHHIKIYADPENELFILTLDDSVTKLVGTQRMNENPTDTPAEIKIWGNSNSGYPVDGVGGDMKYLKIIHSDGVTIVAHYIPCTRNSDSIAGFWDTINQTFNPSSTSVLFTAGYLT